MRRFRDRPLIERMRCRPTGYMRPGKPMDVVLDTLEDVKVPSKFPLAEEWEARLSLFVRYTVPHPDAHSQCHDEAMSHLLDMLFREVHEATERVDRLRFDLSRLKETDPEWRDTWSEMGNAISDLRNMTYGPNI
jgi:hypothetical protein